MAVSALLITLQFRGYDLFQRGEDSARTAASGVGDFASTVFRPISGAWNAAWDYEDLEQENKDLQVQIDELRAATFNEQTASADLAQLFEDLDLTQVGEIPRVAAQVVVPLGNFQSDLVQISKGHSDGLEAGQPVIISAGLVGRITEVRESRSFVRTLTSADFVVGVRFLDSNRVAPAISPGSDGVLVVREDISLAPPPIGTLAVTSGLERSVYPPGVPVGLVTEVEVEEGTLTNVITIAPVVNTSDLSFVWALDYDTGFLGVE